MTTKLETKPLSTAFFEQTDSTLVTWLGMAGAGINVHGTILFIDPLLTMVRKDGEVLSECGHKMKIPLPIEEPAVPRVDAVLYTHTDADHFTEATAIALNRRLKPLFVGPPPVAERLYRFGVESDRVIVARDFETVSIGNAEIYITPTLHDYEQETPFRRGDCSGFLIKTSDGSVWHPGDTRIIPELLEVKGVDILFYDVASVEGHLGAEGSAQIAKTCGARVMLAYHYGTFDMPPGSYGGCDPEDCLPFVTGLDAEFVTPSPGEILHLPLPSKS